MSQNNDRKITIFLCASALIFGLLFKGLPHYFYLQGQKEFKNANFEKAYNCFKKARFFDLRNKDYRYYFVKSMENLPATIDIQKEIFEIATDNNNDSAQQAAINKINEWQSNIYNNIGDNYIEQAPLDNGILRWDENQFPLRVSIYNKSGKNIPTYYNEEILRALSQWQASSGFLSFATTNNSNNANILVVITNPPSNSCSGPNCKYVVGYTTPEYRGSLLKKMTITLYTTDPNGNFFSDKELYNTILHEIGHALGIMGHSYSTEDLMYMASDSDSSFYAPYRSSFQYLSSKDIGTIRLLYKLLPTITNTSQNNIKTEGLIYAPIVLGTSKQISERKLKEAQNYVKNAPEIYGGYVDMAIAYSELGKYSEAIKALNTASNYTKTSDEKYIVSYNLALVYTNWNKLDQAYAYAKEAQQISNNEDVKELISNIEHAKNTKNRAFKTGLRVNFSD